MRDHLLAIADLHRDELVELLDLTDSFVEVSERAIPKVPAMAEIERRRALVDYRTVELDPAAQAVRLPKAHKIGLGGIAKGYIVDRAADLLKKAGIQAFLVQAGGDLYGAGRKPDGSPWISGIQDPRGPEGSSFATIELTDHAFSTAGDYARSYVIGKRRWSESAPQIVTINGAPGLLVRHPTIGDGTYSFDIADGRIRAIYVVRKPDKLRGFLEGTP